jgi:hypothetical protein
LEGHSHAAFDTTRSFESVADEYDARQRAGLFRLLLTVALFNVVFLLLARRVVLMPKSIVAISSTELDTAHPFAIIQIARRV